MTFQWNLLIRPCEVLSRLPTQHRACSRSAKGFTGSSGRNFNVLNKDSEYGLSLLTPGRLREGAIPSRCNVASMVSPRIGDPTDHGRFLLGVGSNLINK